MLSAFSLFLLGAGTITVKASAVKKTSVTYKGKRTTIYCYKGTAGTSKVSGSSAKFTSYKYLLSKTSRTRSRSTYDKYQSLDLLGKKACKSASATPTPTPNPQTGNFDNNGNVTAAGKAIFGIPSNLSANISAGRTVQQVKCTGCHVERTNYTFPVVREKIKQSPMLFDEEQVPDQQLANLVAYLNRFRP